MVRSNGLLQNWCCHVDRDEALNWQDVNHFVSCWWFRGQCELCHIVLSDALHFPPSSLGAWPHAFDGSCENQRILYDFGMCFSLPNEGLCIVNCLSWSDSDRDSLINDLFITVGGVWTRRCPSFRYTVLMSSIPNQSSWSRSFCCEFYTTCILSFAPKGFYFCQGCFDEHTANAVGSLATVSHVCMTSSTQQVEDAVYGIV